jgi:transcriptional regulator with XRE-family HTH domain
MTLGQQIKQRREHLGLSQSEVARLAGIPQPRLSEYERGAKTDMTLWTAKRLARVLGVSIDYLASTWDEEQEPAPPAAAPDSAVAPSRRRGRPRTAAPAAARG